MREPWVLLQVLVGAPGSWSTTILRLSDFWIALVWAARDDPRRHDPPIGPQAQRKG